MKDKQKKLHSFQNNKKEEISNLLKNLPFQSRRTIYDHLVDSALSKNPVESLRKKIKKNKQISNQDEHRNILEITEEFEDLFSKSNNLAKKTIWTIYEDVFSGQYSKRLGQYFTPERLVRLILSSLDQNPKHILDPMGGHGIFLKIAQERFPQSKITSVEIDSLLSKTSKLILDKEINNTINDDVFDWAVDRIKENKDFEFPVVVGNPAYVSYQNLERINKHSKGSKENLNYRESLLNKLKLIAEMKGMSSKLSSLFENWSGYSDLSSYALILSWLLASKEGQISFVMSNHWMKRDYGLPIRKFLANRGEVRCIINHQKINWFSRAQIPTSIVVISKGRGSKKRNKEIPYIEITDPSTKKVNNLKSYLDSIVGQNFWNWVDSLGEEEEYDSLDVSLITWHEKSSTQNIFNPKTTLDLRLPQHLENISLSSFEEVGWKVHQGLRTGCNEVFYVYKDQDNENKYTCTLTKDGEKQEITLEIPKKFLLPAIQKLSSNAPLKLNKKYINAYLLDLRGAILPEDREKIIEKYPSKWLDAWNFEDLDLIPENLSKHLSQCGEMTYEKSRKKSKVKELSAVKPNIRKPKLKEQEKIPDPPRFWYQLPLSSRHFGKVIIPRVNDGPLRSHLIENEESIITDANYVTLIPESELISTKELWTWINSNTFRLICELNGITMGGGALKVETTLVSKIPIPNKLMKKKDDFVPRNMEEVSKKKLENGKIIEIGRELDSHLFNKNVSERNAQELKDLIEKRQKKQKDDY